MEGVGLRFAYSADGCNKSLLRQNIQQVVINDLQRENSSGTLFTVASSARQYSFYLPLLHKLIYNLSYLFRLHIVLVAHFYVNSPPPSVQV